MEQESLRTTFAPPLYSGASLSWLLPIKIGIKIPPQAGNGRQKQRTEDRRKASDLNAVGYRTAKSVAAGVDRGN